MGAKLESLSVAELLALHNAALDELQLRGVLRTQNNPTGDYAEWILARKLGLKLASNSSKGFDATDHDGLRYQIKGRRLTPKSTRKQLGVLRNLGAKEFDYLLAVLFNETWKVTLAIKVPHHAIASISRYSPLQNGNILILGPTVLQNPAVIDITADLNGGSPG